MLKDKPKNFLIVLLIACAIASMYGCRSPAEDVAAAKRGTPAGLPKWQYAEVSGTGSFNLNDMGDEGWELCAYYSGTFIFKRPLPGKTR